MGLQTICKPFNALTPYELYVLLRLRNEVFVVEQNCMYLDTDNIDQVSHHLLLYKEKELIAYARLIPPGISYAEISIGRVVTNIAYRGAGIGKQLMVASIDACKKLYGEGNIKIGAQFYLKNFYESFGFVQCSDVYDEDDIEHIKMIRRSLQN